MSSPENWKNIKYVIIKENRKENKAGPVEAGV